MTKKAEAWHCVPCTGEAHSNPYIDNCGVCAPFFWARVVVPVSCASLHEWRERFGSADDAERKRLSRCQKLAETRLRKAEDEAERARWGTIDAQAAKDFAIRSTVPR